MILVQGSLHKSDLNDSNFSIVSLVPSLTWMLFDFQLSQSILGITRFCKAAGNEHLKYKKYGGTKNPDVEAILKLKPGLILANKEENRKEDIERLAEHSKVYISDVTNLVDMYQMMDEIGFLTNRQPIAKNYIENIKIKFQSFAKEINTNTPVKTVYLIWKNPYMTIGSDTFINSVMAFAGFVNCFSDQLRYPVLSMDEIKKKSPELILLSSEPYPFREKHIREIHPLNARLVDGRMFSWYGTFMLQTFDYLKAFKSSLNPIT